MRTTKPFRGCIPRQTKSPRLWGCITRGCPFDTVRRQLEQEHQNQPSDSTVYGWIERFTKQAIEETKGIKPKVGDVWVADETVLKVGGRKVWFWDIIDAKTRFLLASHISYNRTTRDAQTLMERASRKAGKPPKVVLTDQLSAYLDGIELAWGAETKHITTKGLTAKTNTNLIERFHATLKARTKVMRGLKKRESAQLILDGWLVHYNYFRPHESLDNKTPAEKAGVSLPYHDWADLIRQPSQPVEVSEFKAVELREPIPSKPFKIVRLGRRAF